MMQSDCKCIKLRKISQQVSIGGTRISDVSVVNVAHEEKQEGCFNKYKYQR